ncbi:MAG TPA: tetratricopeptide repeat protein, partial [Pirellulales bacterium]|nr:tetratricopeptide repeat protein [Pirellulales bacterium]
EPASAECFYNRGLAYAALDRRHDALDDYTHALALDPRLAAASLHRGMLLRDAGRFEEAAADFQRAIDDGAEACAVHYQWALLHLARNDRAAAKASLRAALAMDPDDRDSLALLRRLE